MKIKKVTYIIILVSLFVIGVFSLTYAYFEANVYNEESETTIDFSSAALNVLYDGGAKIEEVILMPNQLYTTESGHPTNASDIWTTGAIANNIPWATKNFTVTGRNETTEPMQYNISLMVEKNEFITSPMMYTLTVNTANITYNTNGTTATEVSIPAYINPVTKVVDGENKYVTETGEFVIGTGSFVNTGVSGKTHAYILKIYFPETKTNQSIDMGKKFGTYVKITPQGVTRSSN